MNLKMDIRRKISELHDRTLRWGLVNEFSVIAPEGSGILEKRVLGTLSFKYPSPPLIHKLENFQNSLKNLSAFRLVNMQVYPFQAALFING